VSNWLSTGPSILRRILPLLLLLTCVPVFATTYLEEPLEEAVDSATDIATVKIEAINGRDAKGKLVTTGELYTGPGQGTTLVATIKVKRVLKGEALYVGQRLKLTFGGLRNLDMMGTREIYVGRTVVTFLTKVEGVLAPDSDFEPWRGRTTEAAVKALLAQPPVKQAR